MPRIIIDGQDVPCRDGVSVLQAALEAGWDIPHYCYHPGLSIVASCRLCLMEMKVPDPKTKELAWSPRLVPSCQTPVREGMEVRFDSAAVRQNQQRCMEFFLLNHPLDCPVCDQAGECYLQDYSLRFGQATSRMVDEKYKNPKKDIGSRTLLYMDRCVLCSRCVRFCNEISGTGELAIVQRGSRAEIDVFPGTPLENALQGNVVDVCPVGSLLDKDFLMQQRVWYLQGTRSICPGCSTGCAIRIDHNEGRVWRLKPRLNPGVNDWWMCDEGRFGWKYVNSPQRLTRLVMREGGRETPLDWSRLPSVIREWLTAAARERQGAGVAAVLSPFMSCEEAWLLVRFIRSTAPAAVLAVGPVPVVGRDETFPKEEGKPVKFTIRAEKCPNRRGVEWIVGQAGGEVRRFEDFVSAAAAGRISAAWVFGGYPAGWVDARFAAAAKNIPTLIVTDLFTSPLTETAGLVIPACAWAERSGCFVNVSGLVQPFEAAIPPPEGCQREGQYLAALNGESGLYNAERVRSRMAAELPQFASPHVPPEPPPHAH